PCIGDGKIGTNDCSSQAVRLDADDLNPTTNAYSIIVQDAKALRGKAMIVRKGTMVERCRIASLGQDDVNVNAEKTTSEEVNVKGCTVTIPKDALTGEGGQATISGPGCVFVANGAPVNAGSLVIDGKDVGAFTFGDGFVSSGASSCTTKVVSNRLYTWCTCADANHDGIPDDPKPPCPATVPAP